MALIIGVFKWLTSLAALAATVKTLVTIVKFAWGLLIGLFSARLVPQILMGQA